MEKLQQKIQLALQHVLQKNHREDGILTKVRLLLLFKKPQPSKKKIVHFFYVFLVIIYVVWNLVYLT